MSELANQFIHYRTGDATAPVGAGRKIIAHITNNLGGWGDGFVVPLGQKYPQAKARYEEWFMEGQHRSATFLTEYPPFGLGETQFVIVSPQIMVANMTAQDGYRSATNQHPVDLDALTECLSTLFSRARGLGASIHMPRIGCGLGGGTWDEILACIWEARVITSDGASPSITVYDFA